MHFRGTDCCGIQELTTLSPHKTGEEMMRAFCVGVFGDSPRPQVNYLGGPPSIYGMLYTFYMFTAAVDTPVEKRDPNKYRPFTQHEYGKKFADFILANDLGTIVATEKEVNHTFHPDHSNQVWIWTPEPTKIREWWMKVKASEAEDAKKQEAKLAEARAKDKEYIRQAAEIEARARAQAGAVLPGAAPAGAAAGNEAGLFNPAANLAAQYRNGAGYYALNANLFNEYVNYLVYEPRYPPGQIVPVPAGVQPLAMLNDIAGNPIVQRGMLNVAGGPMQIPIHYERIDVVRDGEDERDNTEDDLDDEVDHYADDYDDNYDDDLDDGDRDLL